MKTKYNLGDKVYLLYHNNIISEIINSIRIDDDGILYGTKEGYYHIESTLYDNPDAVIYDLISRFSSFSKWKNCADI